MNKDFIYIVINDPEHEGEKCLARIHATKLENGIHIHKIERLSMKKDFIYIVINDPEHEGERCLARIHATKLENGIYIHKSCYTELVKDGEDSSHFILKECEPWIITDYRTGIAIVRGNTQQEALDNLEEQRINYIACKNTDIYRRCLEEFKRLATKRILEVEE